GLVEPLVDQSVVVRPIVPVGVSPHGYQLTPSDIADLSRATLVVTVGTPLEPAISRAIDHAVPTEAIFSIAGSLGIDADACSDHGHHEGHDHDHGDAADPHLWLDPGLMLQLVEPLADAIAARSIAHPQQSGYRIALAAGIESIDASYTQELAAFRGRAIVTHHDAFRRIADRYGLEVAQVIRPVSSVEPTPGDLASAAEAIREHGSGAIFIEPQFSDALPRRIADRTGVQVFTLDPVGSDDWINLMRANLRSLVGGLSAAMPGGEVPTMPDG
ncbi:MAG: metal ABC transporter substrate-binding protein, partial [Planctomycetota bacterium]